jgi:hypothetical protein
MRGKRSIRVMMQLWLSAMACVLAAAFRPVPFVNAQANGGVVLTLDEALLQAHSNNRDLKQFGLDVGKQRETLGEAKTHLYPRFDTFVLAAQLLTHHSAPSPSFLLDFCTRSEVDQMGNKRGPEPEPTMTIYQKCIIREENAR